MHTRAFHRLLAVLLVAFFSFPAIAQFSRDASANQKIDEAINQHYLMMELDKAESMLTGVVEACELKCRPATKAKAWMYVGVVRGSGRNDQAAATEAFEKAKSFDPKVELDDGLATPETKATFSQVTGGDSQVTGGEASGTSGGDDGSSAMAAKLSGEEIVPGDMICSPESREIETRMPIPVSCSSALDPTSATLRFKEPGGQKWKQIDMEKVGSEFRATIPCDLTGSAGELNWYVGAKDSTGEYIDQYGSKKEPGTFVLSSDAAGPAPSFPGEQPVTRCGGGGGGGDSADDSDADCPPDFPGCGSGSNEQCGDLDWGAACDHSGQCGCGLICEDGACNNAPSCTTDDDCDVGSCMDGYCGVAAGSETEGPYKRHWFSFSAGMDVSSIGGNDLCSGSRETNYGSFCYAPDGMGGMAPYRLDPTNPEDMRPNPDVNTGLALAQVRLKLGYDFAFASHFMVGARVGIAFLNTNPGSPGSEAEGVPARSGFLPVHAEARFTYVITSLANPGFRPYLFANGGLGEVDAHVADSGIDIYKVSGPIFAGGGLGAGYAFSPNMALKLEVGAAIGIGTGLPNVSIQPSLGLEYGL